MPPSLRSHYHYSLRGWGQFPSTPTHLASPLPLVIFPPIYIHMKLRVQDGGQLSASCQVKAGKYLSLCCLCCHYVGILPTELPPENHQSSLLPWSWRTIFSSITHQALMTCNEPIVISGMYQTSVTWRQRFSFGAMFCSEYHASMSQYFP